ncbi:gluconate transporter [Dactylosporangium aurantiacum]|uniref:Gluconate transporter n=1 Tax=Dactylosporangium aurantiacum TaxID=35754 RepID=A0A9Q9IIF2_9ACTN|nr:SLC13 family permease [Dactylosporangium aurantiacum]MDG6104321.1 SLC13 family permease [Dactylosporangium aurantiacum]UWZ56687.1 gluconate transporter [Dactylosporangium aurantiacum]
MDWTSHDTWLVTWTLVAIAVVVVLITRYKIHPFLALILGSAVVGLGAGLAAANVIAEFEKGFGSTLGGVGILVALGTILGKLLADSGGADRVVDTIVGRAGQRRLPWAMALIAMIIGLPLFFEVGVVLLIPVIFLVARRAGTSIVRVGIPALAGLSVMHGLVPPHPGPLIAIDALHADLGQTLAYGLLVAVPTVIVAGPLYGIWIGRFVNPTPPARLVAAFGIRSTAPAPAPAPAGALAGGGSAGGGGGGGAVPDGGGVAQRASDKADDAVEPSAQGAVGDDVDDAAAGRPASRPGFVLTLATVLLPVVLMLGRAVADITLTKGNRLRTVLDFLGDPFVALLLAVLVALFTFGYLRGFSRQKVSDLVAASLLPIAGIIFIIGAGGGFKQTLVAVGIGDAIGKAAAASGISALLLGWLISVGIRLATGSATVATVTAAGLMAPLLDQLPGTNTALLALAIGSGSLFLSHVNDAGFWLVKEYFGMTVGETFKTWSAMETIISVVSIVLILALGVVV